MADIPSWRCIVHGKHRGPCSSGTGWVSSSTSRRRSLSQSLEGRKRVEWHIPPSLISGVVWRLLNSCNRLGRSIRGSIPWAKYYWTPHWTCFVMRCPGKNGKAGCPRLTCIIESNPVEQVITSFLQYAWEMNNCQVPLRQIVGTILVELHNDSELDMDCNDLSQTRYQISWQERGIYRWGGLTTNTNLPSFSSGFPVILAPWNLEQRHEHIFADLLIDSDFSATGPRRVF